MLVELGEDHHGREETRATTQVQAHRGGVKALRPAKMYCTAWRGSQYKRACRGHSYGYGGLWWNELRLPPPDVALLLWNELMNAGSPSLVVHWLLIYWAWSSSPKISGGKGYHNAAELEHSA